MWPHTPRRGGIGWLIGLACIGALMASPALVAAPADRPPNIIFILTDDQRFDTLGANGNPHIHTPNLDRLASRSVRFTNAHVVMSLCSPSRAAILTGRYGSANGVTRLGAPLDPDETTFAQALKHGGYRTALVGKWHLAGAPESLGFDYACYFRSNGAYHERQLWEHGKVTRPPEHIDDVCVERSIAFLKDAAGSTQPFLLFHATQLPHMDNHHAWPSPEEFRARYDPAKLPLPSTVKGDLDGKPPYLAGVRNRTKADDDGYKDPAAVQRHIRDYYSVITQLDAMIGRLLVAVDRLGLARNTWIVFSSDNGWFLGEHRMTSKVLAYDASVRVPLLIAGPGLAPRVDPALTTNLDLAPTFLELARLPGSKTAHGRSLLPLLRDSHPPWRQEFVYECLDGYGGTRPMLGAITKEWSLIQTWDTREAVGNGEAAFTELYHRSRDPAEARNVAHEPANAAVRERLEGVIQQHVRQLIANQR